MAAAAPATVVHVLFRFAIGGLENGVVNLINSLDPGRYRHAVVCIDDYDADFARRIQRDDVTLHALHKRPGHDPGTWWRFARLLARLRPAIVHTRNFVALEMQAVAACAGVRGRVHGEHGWDVHDLHGDNRKHRLARRVFAPAVHRFIALSRHLEHYLRDDVGIAPRKIVQIYNGVDSARFAPRAETSRPQVVIGTVGRMKAVKNQTYLCAAFADLLRRRPDLRARARLRLVGDGPLRADCQALLAAAGCADAAEFTGDSATVAHEMQGMDLFVLPSLAEGISNTILEAMASGLPVIATAVGGNLELVDEGVTGALVAVDDVPRLSATLERYIDDTALRTAQGNAGRVAAVERYSLAAMVAAYDRVYRDLLS